MKPFNGYVTSEKVLPNGERQYTINTTPSFPEHDPPAVEVIPRRTGHTQRMLEAAIQNKAPKTWVVAHNERYAADLAYRAANMMKGTIYIINRTTLRRPGGKGVIRFISMHERLEPSFCHAIHPHPNDIFYDNAVYLYFMNNYAY